MPVQNYEFSKGDTVMSADGEKLGKVETSTPRIIRIEKGFLFANEYDIPVTAVASYVNGTITLNINKDEAIGSDKAYEEEGTLGDLGDGTANPEMPGMDASQTADSVNEGDQTGFGGRDPFQDRPVSLLNDMEVETVERPKNLGTE